ncbi:MAG: hypothetical protein LBL44_04110 [Treponema sp.]|jgi:hypothetical protein|nr:hypothetical protein [Treponema sp.]
MPNSGTNKECRRRTSRPPGARKEQIKGLADEINKIDGSRFHGKDLTGRVYECLLQVFAIDAGQGAEKGKNASGSTMNGLPP